MIRYNDNMRKTITQLQCKRCLYVWLPRSLEKPRRCPKCGSPYWDKPRRTSSEVKEVNENER